MCILLLPVAWCYYSAQELNLIVHLICLRAKKCCDINQTYEPLNEPSQSSQMTQMRKVDLSLDDYFMAIAILSGMKSSNKEVTALGIRI